MAALYLGLDVGTQGCKAVLLDLEAGPVAGHSESYGLLAGLPPGHAEQHPDTWIEAVSRCAAGVLRGRDPAQVRGLAISGQQHGCVPLDAEGQVIRPAKLWCDTATVAQAEALASQLGRPVPVGFTLSKVAWLRDQEPQNFARTRHVLLPHDYINYRLTGRICMEAGDASGTGWFDVATRSFDAAACAAISPDFLSRQPELCTEEEAIGALNAAGAALLGLPAGVPVAPGGGDNMMSAIGAGAVVPGIMVLSLGTSGTIFCHAEQPVQDPAGLVAGFCSSHGSWLPLLCVMNLTGVTEEVCQAFGMDHARLTAAAAEVEPGSQGLQWFPYLVGERVPALPGARGVLRGMGPGCLAPGVLYRAAMEGTSLNLAWGMQRLRGLGLGADELRVVGGAAQNPLWQQILADTLELPLRRLVDPESAALGAALQAAWVVEGGGSGALVELCGRHVKLGSELVRPGAAVETYRDLRHDFAAGLAELWPETRQ